MKAQKPEFVAAKSRFLRRRRIVKAMRERGAKDTEGRAVPNDVPHNGSRRRRA